MAAPWEGDPSWQAYLRAIGLEREQRRSAAAQQQSALEQLYGVRLSDLAYQGDIAEEQIGESYEQRGLFSSGARLRDTARQQAQEQRQGAMLTASRGSEIAQIQADLARQLAALDTQQAERALGFAQSFAGGGGGGGGGGAAPAGGGGGGGYVNTATQPPATGAYRGPYAGPSKQFSPAKTTPRRQPTRRTGASAY